MRSVMLAALAALAMAGCATPAPSEPLANFDPSACYQRAFNLYFEGSETDISPEAREAIAAIERSVRGCRIEGVRIVGQAGPVGSEHDNMDLSARRAEAVEVYLQRATDWPRSAYSLRAVGEAGAVTDEGVRPLRQRASVIVNAVTP